MSWDFNSATTGTTLATMAPSAVRKLWQKGIDMAEQTEDFFGQMEGASKTSIIQTQTDTSKGKGHKITFTNQSGFYDEGKQGEERFDSEDSYEEILINSYDLDVDYLRHGISITDRTEEAMGMRGEIAMKIPQELGKWAGRMKSERLFMMFREKLNDDNIVYANRKTKDTLGTADTLNYESVLTMGTILKPLGGLPAQIGRVGKNPVYKNCVVATVDALYSLKTDSDYKTLLRDGGVRGMDNCIFKGGYVDIDGHIIKEYNPIIHDGEGAQASPLNPMAFLGEAIVADITGGLEVKGGGNATSAAKTKKKYFKYFPNYAYQFLPGDTLSDDGETHYFLIVNPANAATDPGKIGMYSYTTGNNGNKITVTGALGSDATRSTTLGDVTYNSGAWSGYHTQVHPLNSLIVPCNSKGVPIGWTIMLGQRAAFRGYGKWRNKRTTQMEEGGFVKRTFFTTIFGQKLRQDRLERHNGAILLCHALNLPNVNLPVIA